MSVHEFHESFLIGNAEEPKLVEERDYTLRYNLMKEENDEYLEACQKGDLTKRRLFRPRIRIINVLYCPRFIQHMLLDRYFKEGNG